MAEDARDRKSPEIAEVFYERIRGFRGPFFFLNDFISIPVANTEYYAKDCPSSFL